MRVRFRRSISVGRLVRVNVGKRGLGVGMGVKGLRSWHRLEGHLHFLRRTWYWPLFRQLLSPLGEKPKKGSCIRLISGVRV